MSDHERRLRRLEERTPAGAVSGPIPILLLPSLPEEDRAAFRLAEQIGDWAAIADLTERYTGVRPDQAPAVRLVVVDCVGDRCP